MAKSYTAVSRVDVFEFEDYDTDLEALDAWLFERVGKTSTTEWDRESYPHGWCVVMPDGVYALWEPGVVLYDPVVGFRTDFRLPDEYEVFRWRRRVLLGF